MHGAHRPKNTGRSRLTPRRDDGGSCYDPAEITNAVDIQQAEITLGTSCDLEGDEFLGPWKGVRYAKSGNGVVHTCNLASGSQKCRSSELNDAVTAVRQKCNNGEVVMSVVMRYLLIRSRMMITSNGQSPMVMCTQTVRSVVV